MLSGEDTWDECNVLVHTAIVQFWLAHHYDQYDRVNLEWRSLVLALAVCLTERWQHTRATCLTGTVTAKVLGLMPSS